MKQRSTTNQFGVRFSRGILALVIAGFGLFAISKAVSAETLSEKIANIQSQIDQNRAEADRLRGEANNLQNALSILGAEKSAIQSQIDLNQAKHEQLTGQIEENQKKLEKQQLVLSETVSDLSVESTTSPIELLAGSPSIGDFIDRQEYRSSVQEQIEVAISTVKKLKSQLAEQQKEVETVLAEQKLSRDLLVEKENEQNRLLAATQAQEAGYQSLVSNLEGQRRDMEAALARSISSGSYRTAPAGYVGAGEVVGGVGNSGLSSGSHLHLEVRSGNSRVNPHPYIGNWQSPGYMTQDYGESPQFYGSAGHPGIDYGAPNGTPIQAIASGNMYRGCSDQLLGTSNNAYGYVAIIEQDNGMLSIYAHMSGGPGSCNYNTYYGGL